MISVKELQEMASKEQERILERKERQLSDLLGWVEKECKKAAHNGSFKIEFSIPSSYQWASEQLIEKVTEVGLEVKITSTNPHNNFAENLLISWEAPLEG